MAEMEKMELTEQQKKDVQVLAQLPEDVNRDMKNFMAGLLAAYSRFGGAGEKMAG